VVAGDENQELPADLNNAVEVLGNQIKDDPRVIILLKEKETKAPPKIFQQLRSVFVK
jgi:ATP-dependent Clp protease ATP-binding subunit ClpA